MVAAVGCSGSGKTTLLEYLISHFSGQGCVVGAIKHIHHENFSMDKEGSNTWRYAQAGSEFVVAISPHEIDVIRKTRRELRDLDNLIEILEKEKLDIIFIEGFHSLIAKRRDVLKIITAKDTTELERTLQGTVPPILAASGLVAQTSSGGCFGGIPLVKVPQEGMKIIGLIEAELEKQQQTT